MRFFKIIHSVPFLVFFCFISTLHAENHYSKFAYPEPEGKLIYHEDAQGNRIPDYSYAGYGGGGVALPAAPVKITLEPQAGDDSLRIQEALDAVGKLPMDENGLRGAVLLSAGEYYIKDSLKITHSGVVLRGEGAGKDGTVLYATSKKSSEWAGRWPGCLITVTGKNDFHKIVDSQQEILDETVSVDQTTITVANAENVKAGDRIMVQRNSNQDWVHAIKMDQIPPRRDGKPVRQWQPGPREAYERKVVAVHGNVITIDRPVYNKIQRKYGGGWIYKYEFPGRIHHVGIENLRSVSLWEPQNENDMLDHYAAMLQFFHAENCWARDLTAIHFYGTGIYVGARTRHITVQDCRIENAGPRYYKKHSYVARYGITIGGQDILVQRCEAFNCRHAFSVGSRVAGASVFLDCDGPSSLGASEPHHRWSTGILFDHCGQRHPTPILIMNRGSMGSGHGWTASNSVMWNCIGDPLTVESPLITRNYGIGCKGKRRKGPFEELQEEAYDSWGRHVTPASLYLAQLHDRLGREAVQNVASAEQWSYFNDSGAAPADFYVAPKGNDSNPGTLDKPFATLERAIEAVRQAKILTPDKNYHVAIRNGHYHLTKPLTFGLEDGAADGHTITYAAYGNEQPVISGGMALADWKKPEDYPEGLPEVSRDKVYVHELPAGIDYFATLYKGYERLPRAVSPGALPVHAYGEGFQKGEGNLDPRRYMKYPEGLIRDWPNIRDIEIVIVASVPWSMNILRLENVMPEKNICKTLIPASYPLRRTWGGRTVNPNLWVENAIDYLDEPGEWVVNTLTRKIYYWPRENKPGNNIFLPRMKHLIGVRGETRKAQAQDRPVRGLRFERLTLMHADRDIWQKDDIGIQHDWEMEDKENALICFEAAEKCAVYDCILTNSGGNAVRLDYHCREIEITNNHISHLGQGGIVLIGYGPGTKDVNRNNLIDNNLIHHIGEIYWHSHAIILWQSGDNLVRNNYIRDVPRKAICLSGVRYKFFTDRFLQSGNKPPREYWKTIRWYEVEQRDTWEDVIPYLHTRNNIIEHNEVENAVNMLGDGSAINISGAGENNIIRRNYLHDINNTHISGMMRTDDYQKGTVFEYNILYNSLVGGITLKGENRVVNNYLINVGTTKDDPIHTDPRWGPFDQTEISRNIFFVSGEPQKFYYHFRPENTDVLQDAVIDHNIYFCGNAEATREVPFLQALREAGHDKHSLYLDPLFENWRDNDFRLHRNSPARQLGIEPIDLSNVGLTKDFPQDFLFKSHENARQGSQ